MAAVLEVDGLQITYTAAAGAARAVDGVSFSIEAGEYLGLVGESGCGKSTIAKAVLGILPANGRVTGGEIRFRGRDLVQLTQPELRRLRWREIALVPQSAMNGFDPVYTVEQQLEEAYDRQGLKIACLEEIALAKGLVTLEEMGVTLAAMPHSAYRDYVARVVEEHRSEA